jgi:hypothetical protein
MLEWQCQLEAVDSIKEMLIPKFNVLEYAFKPVFYPCMVEGRANVPCDTVKHLDADNERDECQAGEVLKPRKEISA